MEKIKKKLFYFIVFYRIGLKITFENDQNITVKNSPNKGKKDQKVSLKNYYKIDVKKLAKIMT